MALRFSGRFSVTQAIWLVVDLDADASVGGDEGLGHRRSLWRWAARKLHHSGAPSQPAELRVAKRGRGRDNPPTTRENVPARRSDGTTSRHLRGGTRAPARIGAPNSWRPAGPWRARSSERRIKRPIRAIWAECAAQGLTTLGADPAEARAARNHGCVRRDGPGQRAPRHCRARSPPTSCSPASDAGRELLDGLRKGTARVAVVLGTFDGDAAAGGVAYANGSLNGRACFVEDAATATHFLVLADDPPGAAIVAAERAGDRSHRDAGPCRPALERGEFRDPAGGVRRRFDAERLADVALILRLARRGARDRRGPARLRPGGRACQGAPPVRPAHRPVPGDPAQARQLPDRNSKAPGSSLEHAAEACDRGDERMARVRVGRARLRAARRCARYRSDAPCAGRHRLRRGARGAAPFPPRPCRPCPLRRRAARPGGARRLSARPGRAG